MTEFTLGQKVTGGPRLVRCEHWKRKVRHKVWESGFMDNELIEGIFVGYRTYANGTLEYRKYESAFTADEHFKVALIVPNTRTNAIPVMYDTVKAFAPVELFDSSGTVVIERLPARILEATTIERALSPTATDAERWRLSEQLDYATKMSGCRLDAQLGEVYGPSPAPSKTKRTGE